jgi:primase-polymerase (primpol)-like protein
VNPVEAASLGCVLGVGFVFDQEDEGVPLEVDKVMILGTVYSKAVVARERSVT